MKIKYYSPENNLKKCPKSRTGEHQWEYIDGRWRCKNCGEIDYEAEEEFGNYANW